MTVQVWKTNFIGLNKPSKVLSGTADSYTSISLWPYANGEDDPYWSGGVNPQFYRWQVSFTVNERVHGSHLTRTPFRFNAQDIDVGDFVAGAQDGKVCQIISIISKDDNNIVAIVEDVLRYNTFRDPAGFGLFTMPGPVIFFQINEMGYPMLDPLPGEASSDFADNVLGRFQYLNPLLNYVLEQENNGFEQGDAICIENGMFALSDVNNVIRFIGTVVHPGPGPNQFILRPANGIIDFVPNMPGVVGDYIYPTVDGSGKLTTDDTSRRPIYMKLAVAIPSVTTGTGVDPVAVPGEVIELNKYQITLSSTNLDQVIADINSTTSFHTVTAVKVGAATTAVSGDGGLQSAYGVVAGYEPFTASINGVTVNFVTTVSGSKAYGDPTVADVNDMVIDINNANIPDIIASVDNNNLVITNLSGGSITILNISKDGNGNNFAGPNSVSALPLNTSANTSSHSLRLTRDDGGPIIIRDVQGTYFYRAGVMSGQTGRFALGLNIEQGLRASATRVVASIAARDALHAMVGDQVYVINDEHNEWAVFIYDGSEWQRTGNKRSEETDAKTVNLNIDLSTASSGTLPLATISANRKIIDITVESVNSTGNGNSVTVGTQSNLSLFMDSLDSNLAKDGRYSVTTNYITADFTDILVNLHVGNPHGTLSVKLTYV